MLSDLLLVSGLALLIVAGFLISLVLGIAVAGLGLVLVSLAFADGKGLSWRS
jgi:hypothetical protein